MANTLFVDRDVAPRVSGGSVFEALAKTVPESPKSFGKAECIPLSKFLTEVLPGATQVEVLLEGKHQGNMVSLLSPKDKSAPSLFNWENGFSWAYAGNIADSMKERVKAAGGKVDGVLRFSIQWNDGEEWNQNDFDAHCLEPSGQRIDYRARLSLSGGMLDVDIVQPNKNVPAVENITWMSKTRMRPGEYKFSVHTFAYRGGTDGFSAEVEFNGEIYSFDVRRDSRANQVVDVATVKLSEDGTFSLVKSLSASQVTGREVWGLQTGQFQRVQFITWSPNHWEGEPGKGNKHLFLMLAGAKNPELPNGFYNEFLRPELAQHRRVFEALGASMRAEPSEEQLSGLGFSSTKRDTLVCRVTGHTTRVLQVAL